MFDQMRKKMQTMSFIPKQIVQLKKSKDNSLFFSQLFYFLFSINFLVLSKGAVLFPAISVLKVVKSHLKTGGQT